ncbi:ASPIC/UnbV domain-containing protein, partial [Akkermansiaceae bacterium]|nr:ASPIC/UnbV domain-containing protein [Akkermansiaceae bacterium]
GRMSGSSGASILSALKDGTFEVHDTYNTGVILTGDTKGVTVNEFNGDGIPDLSFTVNNGSVSTFLNTSRKKFVGVRIKGKKGNLRAVGANLTFTTKNGTTQTIEITGGGSYLSQSGNTKFFGLGDDLSGQLSIVWPDGTKFILNDVKQGLVDLMWN